MYNITLLTVVSKPSDFKICKQCQGLNWYENTECIHCISQMKEIASKEFDDSFPAVHKHLQDEYTFYQEEEFMTEAEADQVLVDV